MSSSRTDSRTGCHPSRLVMEPKCSPQLPQPTPRVENTWWLQQHYVLPGGHSLLPRNQPPLPGPSLLAAQGSSHKSPLDFVTHPSPQGKSKKTSNDEERKEELSYEKNYKLFLPLRTSPSQTCKKHPLNHYSRLPELQQRLGVRTPNGPADS